MACKIEEGLWLSSWMDLADQTPDLVISALTEFEVNAYKIADLVKCEWYHVPVEDVPIEDIAKQFLPVIQRIETAQKEGKTVLVHCAAGVSRSPTLVMAYLMWSHGWTRRQAYEHVSRCRPIIDPNDGFMEQLKTFEQVLKTMGRL